MASGLTARTDAASAFCLWLKLNRIVTINMYLKAIPFSIIFVPMSSGKVSNARHHPRSYTKCMRGTLMGRRVHAVVRLPAAEATLQYEVCNAAVADTRAGE